MGVDYHALNKITMKDCFPIPIIEELLDELNVAKYFSKLDLCSRYHRISVATEDAEETTFQIHQGIILGNAV